MEPLALAVLAGHTPPGHELVVADDRMERIPYDAPTDLVAINAETFTAKRAYQIADAFRARGVPVVMGGFHPTLVPDEAQGHADAIILGEAEGVWEQVVADAAAKALKPRYAASGRADLGTMRVDRSVFRGKGYLPVRLVESGRGCNYRCHFCSVTQFFGHQYVRRPVEKVVEEIRRIGAKQVFFVDDNIAADPKESRAFFKALAPLKITWVSQMTIDAARDEELLDVLVESGCLGVLIGFESLSEKNLAQMNKTVNTRSGGYEKPLANLRARALKIYATFLLGYDDDDRAALQRTLDFALLHKFFLVAFNHLVPFPGTPLYDTLRDAGRLLYPAWWLDERYRFDALAFRPKHFTPEELEGECRRMRRAYYSWGNVLGRLDFGNNVTGFKSLAMFLQLNRMLQREVDQKHGLPLGVAEALEPARAGGRR